MLLAFCKNKLLNLLTISLIFLLFHFYSYKCNIFTGKMRPHLIYCHKRVALSFDKNSGSLTSDTGELISEQDNEFTESGWKFYNIGVVTILSFPLCICT